MKLNLSEAVSRYGAEAKAKLTNPAISGEPEDQLRAPLDRLFADLTELCGMSREAFAAVGESSIAELKTRPDFAATLRNVLVGFIEVKAPGKGADPRRYRGHDKEQWEKLQSLPNLLYTDGNSFSLWQNGDLVGSVTLHGDIESSGKSLAAPNDLLTLFDKFVRWEPISPKTAPELAKLSARLCRLLRDEVTKKLGEKSRYLVTVRYGSSGNGGRSSGDRSWSVQPCCTRRMNDRRNVSMTPLSRASFDALTNVW